jgi:hypothetical protein
MGRDFLLASCESGPKNEKHKSLKSKGTIGRVQRARKAGYYKTAGANAVK